MRIYCDMDDILCETAVSLCALAERMFGVRVAYSDIRSFNLQETFALSDDQMHCFMEAAHAPENILANPETPGAVASLKSLAAEGHAVEVVTGRPATSFRATEGWLRNAGLGELPVVYLNKYGRLFSPDGDAPEMVPMKEFLVRRYDVAIDDSPQALSSLAVWKDTQILVFDRPWNQNYALAPNMTRVKDWSAIMGIITEKERSRL